MKRLVGALFLFLTWGGSGFLFITAQSGKSFDANKYLPFFNNSYVTNLSAGLFGLLTVGAIVVAIAAIFRKPGQSISEFFQL